MSLLMRSAAGGETGVPRAQRGTRLKATTERAFLVSAGFPTAGVATEEACSSLPAVRNGIFPFQSKAAQRVESPRSPGASPSRTGDELTTRITGRFAARSPGESANDRAHPPIP